ncbi:MAG TPA: ABC transporter ATP-binding protein [Nitrososphaeraceae archaeon]|nr:ABC transporter ATP-binding protein [Nitrososphaeraceae archaeon]
MLLFSRLSEYFLSRIIIKNLSKSYGNVNAVVKFSVQIDSGNFLVLLGPSGCGKTTIIKCIAGLIDPTEGQIYIDESLINKLQPKDRDVAMVFQSYALYPHMSVYDNIAFPLKMRKLSKNEIKYHVENTASVLELSLFLKRKPKELSGGQMQRVALARALVRKPKLFLMDEPLSNLDAKLRMQMRTEIKKLQKKIGITTIYITHDQIEAMSMADQIIVMNKGIIQQIGSPHEIYYKPKNVFVANFIGNPPMNFLNFNISQSSQDINLYSSQLFVKVSKINIPLSEGQSSEVILGIRPKDILIYDTNHKNEIDTLSLKGQLLFTESLGDEVIYEFKLENNSIVKVSSNTDKFYYKQNDEFNLVVKYKNIHFFDSITEERLLF